MDLLRIPDNDARSARCRRKWVSAQLLLSLSLLCGGGQAAFAAQIIRYQISLDGKPVLAASTTGHNEDSDTVWRLLKKLPLRRVKGYKIVPDRDDPLRSTLQGSIVVQCDEGGLAEVYSLRLQRESESGTWSLAEIEVNRTFASRHKPYVFVVSVDGKPELSTGLLSRRGVAAPDDRERVWNSLKASELVPIKRFKIVADADDPLKATLKAGLTIKLEYNRQSWGSVPVSELKFVRKTPKARWTIAPDDAKRIAAEGASGS